MRCLFVLVLTLFSFLVFAVEIAQGPPEKARIGLYFYHFNAQQAICLNSNSTPNAPEMDGTLSGAMFGFEPSEKSNLYDQPAPAKWYLDTRVVHFHFTRFAHFKSGRTWIRA